MLFAKHEKPLSRTFFMSIFNYNHLMLYVAKQNQVLQNTFNLWNTFNMRIYTLETQIWNPSKIKCFCNKVEGITMTKPLYSLEFPIKIRRQVENTLWGRCWICLIYWKILGKRCLAFISITIQTTNFFEILIMSNCNLHFIFLCIIVTYNL